MQETIKVKVLVKWRERGSPFTCAVLLVVFLHSTHYILLYGFQVLFINYDMNNAYMTKSNANDNNTEMTLQ